MLAKLKHGATISDIARKYTEYNYWEILFTLNTYSFLGQKRTISNHLKKLVDESSKKERRAIASKTKDLLDELYQSLKKNSGKLRDINKILEK